MKLRKMSPCRTTFYLILLSAFCVKAEIPALGADENFPRADPKFSAPIANVTVPVGREAILTCVVQDLSSFKVAWLRVDTQTILTIHSHVITKNHRIGVLHSERTSWLLRVRDVRESDRGWYMCQINTDPMKSQVGYLDVVVPPDILDYPTSADMVVREGSNVTLRCAATGSPPPTIVWRREGGETIPLISQTEALMSVEGPVFSITRVNRLHMGPYLCIATNGVPPSVSKRVMLIVHFAPMIWIPNQLIGAGEGHTVVLECHSEAYPKSINYWTREKGEIVPQGGRFEPAISEGSDAYKVVMKLTIRNVGPSDYGTYKCVAKNSLGDTDGSIKLYHIPKSALQNYDSDLHKGKNRKQYGHGPNDIRDDGGENVAGQRDLKLRGRGGSDGSISPATKSESSKCLISVVVMSLLISSHCSRRV
ncbi:opioid-binding protein/cell adhesion molecule homolog isoform X2 [Ctenocephalides felis]|uniref:opioid-binding protein/cell adhesion molecule homolog isoform X2 n=2 Tax=Ctenocephalides felis TaxID=7515 RepID=UPI000E6E1E2F|nr:opioid-binding protein/cell adhesion molecule homolog isoform X2 [Ctenocephalides felis]